MPQKHNPEPTYLNAESEMQAAYDESAVSLRAVFSILQ